MQSSQKRQKKKGYAPENFSVRSVNLIPATPLPMTTTTTTTRWWWCAASLRMEQVLTFDWQHWPLSFEAQAQAQAELALVNGLAALYKLAQLQLYASCPVGPTSPPLPLTPAPSKQSVHCWTKTNTTICDQDDAGSLSFSDCVAFRFHFHFHFPCFVFVLSLSFCFVLFLLYLLPPPFFALSTIVMGIMEKIVLHLNNNTRT